MARRAILEVAPALLVEMLRGHPMSEVTSDVPADLRIVSVIPDDGLRTFSALRFVVESAAFDDVPEGAYLPLWTPTHTLRRSELAAILDLVRPDS